MKNKFYITSAIPYVNAKPHIGHALEFVQTDVIARYNKLLGKDVLKLCGGDENALKNVQAAEKEDVPIQKFVDKNNKLFEELTAKLNCKYDIWQKGSDPKHHNSSQYLWNLVKKNNPDDIYEKEYEGLYCIGCETFYTRDELNEDGECFEHPGKQLEKVREKNYFFRLSNYQNQLKEIIESNDIEIYPSHRKNEVLQFIEQGLTDISISRSNERARNWGVPVPGDPTQRMYVWFDALNIYQSGIGLGKDEKTYKRWWPADLHVIGKGIIRFHAIYWPAFLLSAGLELPTAIFVHDYFTVNGQKMSKTLGNVVDPVELIDKYGADPLRYYFLAKFSPFSDGDFSEEKFKQVYNGDLANGLGNLVARVLTLAQKFSKGKVPSIDNVADTHPLRVDDSIHNWKKSWKDIDLHTPRFEYNEALASIWKFIAEADTYINKKEPWRLAEKDVKEFNWVLYGLLDSLHQIAWQINPFLPGTSTEIAQRLGVKKLLGKNILYKDSWTNIPQGSKLEFGKSLFPRLK